MIDYVGNGAPKLPVPPKGALYYDQVDGVLYGSVPSKGIWFVIGGGGAGIAVPIIQASSEGVYVTAIPPTLTITAEATVMYALSISMESDGSGVPGGTVIMTFAWTSPVEPHTQTETLHTDSSNLVVETLPILCVSGTPISVSFAYGGGAVHDAFSYSVRIVQMP